MIRLSVQYGRCAILVIFPRGEYFQATGSKAVEY